MKRIRIIFKGRVQGVGFRWTISNTAHKYAISGFCSNLDNGDVLVEIQGNSDNLDAFMQDILKSQNYIRIDDYTIKYIDIIENETIFEVIY